MELKLTRTDTDRFVPVQDNVCGREETLEMIVPDACPDIAQVVDTCGCCCLTRREITDSGAVLAPEHGQRLSAACKGVGRLC